MVETVSSVAPTRPEPEFQAWAQQHAHERRLHEAQLAQIAQHHDPNPDGDAVHQLQAWAKRQTREKHLHASAIALMRHG